MCVHNSVEIHVTLRLCPVLHKPNDKTESPLLSPAIIGSPFLTVFSTVREVNQEISTFDLSSKLYAALVETNVCPEGCYYMATVHRSLSENILTSIRRQQSVGSH